MQMTYEIGLLNLRRGRQYMEKVLQRDQRGSTRV